MRRRRRRRSYFVLKNDIEMGGESVATWIDVDRGVDGSDVKGLFDAPLDPV